MNRVVRMFKPRFADLVRSGAKKQTVRPVPKRMPAPGWLLDARQWSGRPYNSPQVAIGEYRLLRVASITIDSRIRLSGEWLNEDARERFAIADGFAGWDEMREWFAAEHSLPFSGVCFFWE